MVEPLAVIGMACRLPGAPDLEAYWRNILSDRISIQALPPARFDRARYFDPEVGAYAKSYCDLGGIVDDQTIDPSRLGLDAEQLQSADLAQLWALDVALSAFEDAGYPRERARGKNCGVFVGHARGSMLSSDFGFGTAVEGLLDALPNVSEIAKLSIAERDALRQGVIHAAHRRYPERNSNTRSTLPASLAGGIATHLGLVGRHLVVDAACASSFAALDMAAAALRRGTLDMALVGGASYSQTMSVVFFAQSRALSPDGSFPFDARANGFISSDGVALVLLKRLSDAVRDGDPIRAVIRGVGGSCDGKGKALWAPKKEGQILAIERAYEGLEFGPQTLGLVEAHATSTQLGDATEIDAWTDVLGRGGRPLPIGSVKGNIGHTRETAGAAGLIKAILALEHRTLPPTGGFQAPNPSIPWDSAPVEVATTARSFEALHGPRRVGIDAFGIGGLNFHTVVEEAPAERSSVTVPANLSPSAPSAIAIVGVGVKLPGAPDPERFWQGLLDGTDAIGSVPSDRWRPEIYLDRSHPRAHRSTADRGAFLQDFEADWRRYKVPPKLVERTDPLQFMMLEAALDAIEDAKLDFDSARRNRTAVVVGTGFGSDYQLDLSLGLRAPELAEIVAEQMGRSSDTDLIAQVTEAIRKQLPSINEDSSGSISSSTVASRVSKTLDFMGPSFAIDASCASSFAALEAAVDLLATHQIDTVVLGGADRSMNIQRYESYSLGGVLSEQGVVRPFDATADGFIPGEGASAFILERLEDAERQGHHIYAVVRSVRSATAQGDLGAALERVMREALGAAERSSDEISFVECHGSGVAKQDQSEASALGKVYLDHARKTPLRLGSVKANVGHTQGAAGAVSLAKTALSLEHGRVPPTPHFESPNSTLASLVGARISTRVEPFEDPNTSAAITGISLTDAIYHIVLDAPSRVRATKVDAPARVERSSHLPRPLNMNDQPRIFRIHAPGRDQLEALLGRVEAGALWTDRVIGRGPAVAVMIADTEQDLAEATSAAAKSGFRPGTARFLQKRGVFLREQPTEGSRVCFLFSGQGSQYPGMLRAVHDAVPAARLTLARMDTWLHARGLNPISATIFSDTIANEVLTVQLSMLAADLMAYEALLSRGIEPDLVTGHSYGDYAALVAARAWALEDALEATVVRARAIASTVDGGGMMSASASAAEIEPLISGLSSVFVSNLNAPTQTVLSGSQPGLEAAEQQLGAAGIETQRLPVPRPFHCPLMESAREGLQSGLASIPITTPAIPYLSSVTADLQSDPEEIRKSLIEQLTRPVDFNAQIRRLTELGADVLIESGPKGTLASLATSILDSVHRDDIDVIASDDAQRPGPWSIARVKALLVSREQSPESQLPVRADRSSESALVLLDGEAADRLRAQAGFDAFWSRHRTHLAKLVENMWEAERGPQSREAAVVPTPELAAPSAIERAAEVPSEAPSRVSVAARTPALEDPIRDVSDGDVSDGVSDSAPASIPDRAELERFLLDAICEQTGYPADIIELDADLEADLGIDTVKQAQVLGKVRDRYRLTADPDLTLGDVPTITHVVDYILRRFQEAPPPAPEATAKTPGTEIPTIDITKRRSEKPRRVDSLEKKAKAKPLETTVVVSREHPEPGTEGLSTRSSVEAPALISTRKEEMPSVSPTVSRASQAVVVLHLEGTAKEIGRQHGAALSEEIHELLRRYERLAEQHGLALEAASSLARDFEQFFSADTRAEIAGIAEGAGLPYEYLLAYNLDAALFPSYAPGCTQGFIRNGGELGPLHFVNEDSPLLIRLGGAHPRIVQIRDRVDAPSPARRTVFFSLAGQVCGPNALSSTGLCVTSCALLDGPPARGLPKRPPHPELIKRIAEGCDRIEDAMRLVREEGGAGRWGVLLSDVDEDRASFVELDDGQVLSEESVDERFVSANHARSGPSKGSSAPQHSIHRAARAETLIGNEDFDLTSAKALLRDRFDAGRGRVVQHPTMNTVRRVDNVMSLVVEPKSRRMHLTDRVLSAGSPEDSDFRTLSYQRPSLPRAARRRTVPPVLHAPDDFEGLERTDEVMTRHALRLLFEDAPAVVERFQPRSVLLFGEGLVVDALHAHFEARGAHVEVSHDVGRALEIAELEALDTIGLVLPNAKAARAWELSVREWEERRQVFADRPFELFKNLVPGLGRGTVFAVTTMGGAFGFDNLPQGTPEGAAVLGLLKSIRHEHPDLRVLSLDVSSSAAPARIVDALLSELDAGAPELEVGLMRGRRVRPILVPTAASGFELGATALPESWLVTGGARGVTGVVCRRLAALYRPRLHLVGRTPLPDEARLDEWRKLGEAGIRALETSWLEEMKRQPGFSPIAWTKRCEAFERVLEIDQNLRSLAELGADVHYHAVDLADREAIDSLLRNIEREGPIEGLLHGAGVEVAKPFSKKSEEIYRSTLSGKVSGLVNLLGALSDQPLSHIVAFSSVSGRFGGHGQTDYALANELMSRVLISYRADHPELRASVFGWPAWGEVGMAARPSSKAFLEHAGQTFMSPVEGANHVVRELWAGLPEPEVLFCDDLALLDRDRQLPAPAESAVRQTLIERAKPSPMLGRLVYGAKDRALFERRIDSAEPFLDQHRIGSTPILPGVIGLEVLAELAAAVDSSKTVGEVEILHALKLRVGRALDVRAERKGDALRLSAGVVTERGVVLEPDRVHVIGRMVERQSLPKPRGLAEPDELVPYPYPGAPDQSSGSRLIFHGPVFRCLEGVHSTKIGLGVARLIVPPVEALVPGSKAEHWSLPAALLDGCLQAAGLLGRIQFGITALPIAFGRIDISPRILQATGEPVRLEIEIRKVDEATLESDLLVVGADGPLVHVTRYRARGVAGVLS